MSDGKHRFEISSYPLRGKRPVGLSISGGAMEIQLINHERTRDEVAQGTVVKSNFAGLTRNKKEVS